MNMLSLDDERIILQKGEEPLKKLLISLGMKPIEVNMIDAFGLGGAFHCWTVDVKRIGKLESYFWNPLAAWMFYIRQTNTLLTFISIYIVILIPQINILIQFLEICLKNLLLNCDFVLTDWSWHLNTGVIW